MQGSVRSARQAICLCSPRTEVVRRYNVAIQGGYADCSCSLGCGTSVDALGSTSCFPWAMRTVLLARRLTFATRRRMLGIWNAADILTVDLGSGDIAGRVEACAGWAAYAGGAPLLRRGR